MPVAAQDSVATGREWRPRFEGTVVLGALFGATLVGPFDNRLKHSMQSPRLQSDRAMARTADVARVVGSSYGALILSAGVSVAGWATDRPGLTDAGWHATEAIALGGVVTSAIKYVVGRARPYAIVADGDEFAPFRGYKEDWSSMPSGHTTVAFAAASAFSAELGRSRPRAARIVRPLLYAGAVAIGASRMYEDRHWASDVIVGAGVGTFIGRRVVAHAHRRSTR